MTYSEKLKGPRWQKLRLEVFERDEWTCQWCYNKDMTLTGAIEYLLAHKDIQKTILTLL